jgi:signal transduction histidine kinase/ActR/RegA family two-component response regulator
MPRADASAPSVHLDGLPAPMSAAVRAALRPRGWRIADDATTAQAPTDLRVLVLGPAATAAARAGHHAPGAAATVLLLPDAAAAVQARALAIPPTWLVLPWPMPDEVLDFSLRRALGAATAPHGDADEHAPMSLAAALGDAGLFDFEYDLASGLRRPRARDAAILGGSPADFAAMLDLMHPGDRARIEAAFAHTRLTGERFHVELRIKLASGAYRWMRSEGTVVSRTADHPGRLLGVSWDIQDEREAKDLARAARQRLDDAMAAAGMLSWEWSRQHGRRVIVGNGLRATGVEALDASGTLDDLIVAEDRAEDLARFDTAIATGGRYRSTVRVRDAGPEPVWLQLSGEPRSDASGTVVAMSGLGLDVTRRRVMDEELADARALLLESLEAGRMYCWEWNLRDGSRRTIGPSREILGTAPGSGTEAMALIHPDDAATDRYLLETAIARGQPYQNEFRILRPDGEVRWVFSRCNPIVGPDGVVERVSGVAVDVSERRRAEDHLLDAHHRLDIALEAARLNPWSLHLATNQSSGGPRDAELFGEEITSVAHLRSFVLADDLPLLDGLRDPAFLASGQSRRVEFRIRRRDGQLRWLASHAQATLDNHGRPVQLVGVSYDISEAREAQDKLSRSLTQFDRVQTATNVVLWEWDRRRGARYLQSGGVEISGADLPAIHPDDVRRLARRVLAAARCNEGFEQEIRLRLPTGQYAWVSVQGRRTGLESDGGGRLSGVLVDITSRKQVTERLVAAEERLRRALDAANMMCWDWFATPDARSGAPVLDYSPTTAGGIVHPLDQPRHRQAIASALSGASADYRCEFRVLLDDGSIRWLLSIGRRLTDASGRVAGLTGVAIDVSEQKELEAALEESREWQRTAAAAGELNLWRVDIDTGIRHGGDLDARVFGFAPGNVQQVEQMIHPDDRERVDVAWRTSIERGGAYGVDYRIVMPDASLRWLRVRGERVADHRTGNLQMVGATMDISDQVRAEVELKSALAAARQASEAKSAFLASISHEIRTPLNAVIGFSGLLSASGLDGTQLSHLHAIHASAQQLLALVNDVLDFSRIEAGELTLESTAFLLHDCLEGALDMIAPIADDKGLCLFMTSTGVANRKVVGDPTRLRQVVLNLLSNAAKFTDQGEVSLSLETRERGEDLEVVVSVRDTGIGMSPAVIARLFQPFRQGDVSTTRQFGGTGLGLSITRRLLDMMAATIRVESRLGEGSCFEVALTLPFAEPMASEPLALGALRVGVAVRSPAMRSGLHRQLRAFGASVEDIDASDLSFFRTPDAASLSALVVDEPLLDTIRDTAAGPRSPRDEPVPTVVLVGIDRPLRAWVGPSGERFLPLSRAIKPRALQRALAAAVDAPSLAAQPPSAPEAMPLSLSDRLDGLSVLVVEDNEINQSLLLLQLESLGTSAMLASGGAEAIGMLAAGRFDIVLMDVEMPGMDGIETTAQLRGDQRFAQRPPYIIATTAHVIRGSRERFLAAGMDDFISKPIMMDKLRDALLRAAAARGRA